MRCNARSHSATWTGRGGSSLRTTSWRTLAGDQRGLEVLKRYDSEFHRALLSACGSRVLLDAHAAVFDKYVRYLMIAVIFRDAAPPEHQKLLECALKRDAKAAEAILSTHIMDCVSFTLAHTPANLLGIHRATAMRRQRADLAAISA
jgi:DNA-binding FadR family transcriptional regulator